MTNSLLTICSANVCRSPLALAIIDHTLAAGSFHHTITLRSRGVDVEVGREACEVALQLARSHRVGTRLVDEHRAATLDPDALAAADLVLTADRRVRSRVVKLDPKAAERTFTFREAAALARLVTRDDAERPPDLAGFAAALNDNRGLTDLPALERPLVRPWHRLRVHAHDVPDAHADHQVSHRVVYRTLVPAVQELAAELSAFASAPRR